MQLKLDMRDSIPSSAKNVAVQYSLLALCNKCGATHDMAVSVMLNDGPTDKQSIGKSYNGTTVTKRLADITDHSISCHKTGRQSIQKDKLQILLVPAKN